MMNNVQFGGARLEHRHHIERSHYAGVQVHCGGKRHEALNMRLVADQCHIALGTQYILLLLSLKKIAKN